MNPGRDPIHASVEELVPAAGWGLADGAEQAAVEQHVRTCARCRAALADYQLLADEMLYAIPMVEAPARLADRLRQFLAAEARSRTRRARAGAWRRALSWPLRDMPRFALVGWVALATTLLLLLASNLYWSRRMTRMAGQAAAQATAIVALAESPRAELVVENGAPGARGVLYYRPDARVAVLHVYELPPLEATRGYQVWLVRDAMRESVGVFRVAEGEEEATLLIEAALPLAEYQAVEVTVEPAGGSPGPTTPRVMWGELGQREPPPHGGGD